MKEILKEYFGFNDFKPLQEKAVKEILNKKDILVILPTGSGKSLIYQLPTLMMDGVTIVISPLIALMQDQVSSLRLNGINAKMISSNNTEEENSQTIKELLENRLKLLYISPERFVGGEFMSILRRCKINFFVIDEAHCISEWGHEFRGDYRKLSRLKEWFEDIPVSAFTATATKEVQEDIQKILGIEKHRVIRAKAFRDNIVIKAERKRGDSKERIIGFLNEHKNDSGIIYCFSRKETERLCGFLNDRGFNAKAYHAGLDKRFRNDIFEAFKNDTVNIIVATVAFGMGIDKSDIRFVLHTSMPKTLENYFQEIGRAGRDGVMSEALLLFSKADELSKKVFLDELPDSTYKQNMYIKMEKMYKYAVTSTCRHQYIAKYFGDEIESCQSLCDNCLEKDAERTDITLQAQKFISAVLRTGERFGSSYIIDVLRGSKSKRILDFSHDKLSVYGIGKEFDKNRWGLVYEKLLDNEAIKIDGEFGGLKVDKNAKRILKNDLAVTVKERELNGTKTVKNKIVKDKSFERFRLLRSELAKEKNVPAYIVFSDKTLLEISEKLPQNQEEFSKINGVGEKKLNDYADIFINLCKEIKKESPAQLSETYLKTLSLIDDNLDIKEIAKQRELNENTVLTHIAKLHQCGYIDGDKKEALVEPLKNDFPKEIKEWIKDGLNIKEIDELRNYLYRYQRLFLS
ncbi:MAG: DNA helicase RecQ [Epsilonproteobacteria bacterium]|nr:DNA helicase RecQ [Campylobacterota bacterium]